MKKLWSVLLILFVSSLIIASFSACDQVKISNLKANKHFKLANKFFSEEKYKKAIAEYEDALKLNPNLKAAFYYLGSSYVWFTNRAMTPKRTRNSATRPPNICRRPWSWIRITRISSRRWVTSTTR